MAISMLDIEFSFDKDLRKENYRGGGIILDPYVQISAVDHNFKLKSKIQE